MTEAKKQWKEADNKVEVVGVLAENNLELREFDVYENGSPTGAKRKAVAGDLVIRSGENENHTVRLRQYELTNAGKVNRLYAGLVTIMNETVSIADTEQNSEAIPSRIKVVGDLRLNEYAGNDGEIRSFPSIQGTFVNRLDVDDKTENKAEFDLEGMVGRVTEDFNRDGEETGRKKVSLLIPLYNSVIPVEFVVNEGKGADYIGDNFDNGSSVRIYGDIVNYQEIIKREVEMGFGENKIEESRKFVNELNIKGGNLYDEDANPSKIIDPELVKQKLVEREVYLENLKNRAKEREQGGSSKPKNGFGGTPSAPKINTLDGNATAGVDLTGLF